MKIDKIGLEHLEKVEAKRYKSYLDSNGKPTIGIGHFLTKSELSSGKIWIKGDQNKQGVFIRYRNGISDSDVYTILIQDLIPVESTINMAVKVPLTQNQYNALCSFVFNIGVNAFINSTLLKKLNQKEYNEIPTQMRRWIFDDGKIIKGLVNRRESDIKLWLMQ